MISGVQPERLKKRPQFLQVAAAGRKWVAPGMIVQAKLRDPGEPGCRVGFTVSKKVGNAVLRNRARRRLRAIVAETASLYSVPACDLVVIGRAATLDRPYADLRRDFDQAIRRLVIQPRE